VYHAPRAASNVTEITTATTTWRVTTELTLLLVGVDEIDPMRPGLQRSQFSSVLVL